MSSQTMSGGEISQSEIIRRNISSITQVQDDDLAERTRANRVADGITEFSGSMIFVLLHVAWFGVWILLNVGVVHIPQVSEFDPFPFGLLTMIVSLEAIFLSTFVLISQNRMAKMAEQRAELDLHINLLAEQKATKTLELLDQISQQLGNIHERFEHVADPEVEALKKSPEPHEVLQVMRETIREETTGEIKKEVKKAVEDITDEMEAVRQEVEEIDVREEVEEVGSRVKGVESELHEIKTKMRTGEHEPVSAK